MPIHWIGLDWIGLDWIGLDWIGLDWIGLEAISLYPLRLLRFCEKINSSPVSEKQMKHKDE
jgi:hypothetical protein